MEYIVFITLVRNLTDKKSVTYDQLAEDLAMDKNNIAKYIKKLQKERCLIVQKEHTDKGYECNKYHFTSPEYFREQSRDNTIPFNKENVTIDIDNDDVDNKELTIKLLA